MNAKKLLLTGAVAFATVFAANAQFKLGVQGGIALNTPNVEGVTNKENLTKPTFGLVAQYDFGGFMFRPSVNYLQSGYSSSTSSTVAGITTATENIVKTNNLEIPLDLVLPLKMKKGRLLFSLSPVVTVGLKGTLESNNTVTVGSGAPTTSSVTGNLNYGSASGEIKKVDWGGRIGVGYEFNKVQVNLNYKSGITNLSNNSNAYKNHYIGLTVSYFLFGGAPKASSN
jgi:hypothetical protein